MENNQTEKLGSFIIQQAQKAAKLAEETMAKMTQLTEGLPATEERIRVLEEKEKQLTDSLKEQERVAKVDLDIRIKENQRKTVEEILKEQGLVAVDQIILDDHNNLKQNFKTEVASAVNAAVANATRAHESDKKLLEAAFKAEQAQNQSKISSQGDVIENLREQVASLQGQIKEDREARVKEAQARGGTTINVPSSGK